MSKNTQPEWASKVHVQEEGTKQEIVILDIKDDLMDESVNKTNVMGHAEFAITNKSEFAIMFNIKTTDPHSFQISTMKGIILSGHAGQVKITTTKPIISREASQLSNSKFLVQLSKLDFVPKNDIQMNDLDTLWNLADKEQLALKTLTTELTISIKELIEMLPTKEVELKNSVQSILKEDAIIYTADGLIDFPQHCKFLKFCLKMARTQLVPIFKNLREKRRELKDANKLDEYRNLVLQKKGMEQKMEKQVIDQVLVKLGIEKEVYAKTMSAYIADAQKKSIINSIIRDIQEVPEISLEDNQKLQGFSKSKLLEIVQSQMDQQVSTIEKMMTTPPEADPREQQLVVLVMKAQDEDQMFEKTGVEFDIFNSFVINSQLDQDPGFHLIQKEAQRQIQEIQSKVAAQKAAAAGQK